jgi:hypothetical protein
MELLDNIVINGLLISSCTGVMSKDGSSVPIIRTISLSVIMPTGLLALLLSLLPFFWSLP